MMQQAFVQTASFAATKLAQFSGGVCEVVVPAAGTTKGTALHASCRHQLSALAAVLPVCVDRTSHKTSHCSIHQIIPVSKSSLSS